MTCYDSARDNGQLCSFLRVCVNTCKFLSTRVHQSCVCLKTGREGSRGCIQVPPLPPGPLASALLALRRLFCDSLTERLESFLFRLREMPLPEKLLVNHFSSFYFTLYLLWLSEPSWIRGMEVCRNMRGREGKREEGRWAMTQREISGPYMLPGSAGVSKYASRHTCY